MMALAIELQYSIRTLLISRLLASFITTEVLTFAFEHSTDNNRTALALAQVGSVDHKNGFTSDITKSLVIKVLAIL
jgi:hypothetical protein